VKIEYIPGTQQLIETRAKVTTVVPKVANEKINASQKGVKYYST
jgi:hypothetical protein